MLNKLLKKEIEKTLNIRIHGPLENKINIFYQELKKWNKVVSLTGNLNEEIFWIKHFCDSLFAKDYLAGSEKVADVGSGAGLPGIPLKLFYPDLDLKIGRVSCRERV